MGEIGRRSCVIARHALRCGVNEILKSVNALNAAGPSNLDKQEVEIDPDYGLQYKNIISALSACSGKMVDGKMVRYIKKIKFAPIREPQ